MHDHVVGFFEESEAEGSVFSFPKADVLARIEHLVLKECPHEVPRMPVMMRRTRGDRLREKAEDEREVAVFSVCSVCS